MIKRIASICISTVVIFSSRAYCQAEVTVQKLDSIFTNWKPTEPGGVVSVIDHGSIVYKKEFGLADVKRKLRNGLTVQYELASIAKQFTAMCIALLEEQGKLSSDDDLKKYYPDMNIRQNIKIKNLLDHTSGLRDASVLAILSGKMNLKGNVRKKYQTKGYYIKCFKKETDLNFEPGSELAYTNFNYVLLGDIIEKVSGQSISRFSDSAIFKPLGMMQTVWRDKAGMSIANEAAGYRYTGKKFKLVKPFGGIVGDHNLVSTADDLEKWQLNFFHNRLGKGDPELMRRVTTSSTLNNSKPTQYSYGQWIFNYKGVRLVSHGGDDGRHTSIMLRFPDQELVIIVLTNTSRWRDTQQKGYAIADLLLKGVLKQPEKKNKQFEFIKVPEAELKKREGLYTRIDDRGLAQLAKVSVVNGELYSSRGYYWQGLKFSPVSTDVFVVANPNNDFVKITFSEENGKVWLTENHLDNPARWYERLENSHFDGKVFAGKYTNRSTGATIHVKGKKDKLVARKGILRIPLVAFATDRFYGPANDVLFVFERDSKGNVDSFKAYASDFRNFSFIKE